MNRPIKFRAWDRKTKVMRTVDDLQNLWTLNSHEGDAKTIPHVIAVNQSYRGDDLEMVVDKDCDLMQSTGLTDKNGKEIYEGDVVKGNIVAPQLLVGQTRENSSTQMAGIVEYDYDGFILRAIQSMCDPEREGNANWFAFAGDAYDGDFEDMEVIGNIYENPDLLTNK